MSGILRYLRFHLNRETETDKFQNFEIDKVNRGGYPSDIVTFAYDFGAVVIATLSGRLLFYGEEGTCCDIDLSERESTNQQTKILKLFFLEADKVLVVCEGSVIINVRLQDGKLTKQQSALLDNSVNYVWNETHTQRLSNLENALLFYSHENVYRLLYNSAKVSIIIPETDISTWKSATSSISCITTLPSTPSIIFILTNEGMTGVYNESQLLKTMDLKNCEGESIQKLVWRPDIINVAYGISCSNMFTKWTFSLDNECILTNKELNSDSSFNFGPYPCNRVKHLNVCTGKNEKDPDFLIFQGGKSSGKYDERHLVSILQGDRFEKFELSSEVIGIACASHTREFVGRSGIALIFTNCEIIGIDLDNVDFHVLQPRWFLSINNSNPTAHTRITNIDYIVWKRLQMASRTYWSTASVSTKIWPLYSNKEKHYDLQSKNTIDHQIYISGHSNGNICVWNTSDKTMTLMLIIKTSTEFGFSNNLDNKQCEKTSDRIKYKIRKIGFYDPFDDEVELQIKHIHFDPQSGTLVAANRGGYILIYDYSELAEKIPCWKPISTDGSQFILKPLQPRTVELEYATGYQLRKKHNSTEPLVLVVNTSNKIVNLSYSHKYYCLAIGGTFGLICVDANHGYIVYTNSFRDGERFDAHVNIQLHRFKNLKKSLRKTFRRNRKTELRKTETESDQLLENTQYEIVGKRDVIERKIGTKDEIQETVQEEQVTCLRFMKFPLSDVESVDDVIAVGLNIGVVYFYKINEHCSSIKESFNVKHAARILPSSNSPVLNIDITNEENCFSASTKLIVITEEDVRVFNFLPLTKKSSYKITAREGLKIKNGIVVKSKDYNMPQTCILMLTNDGWLRTHSVIKPSLFYKNRFINSTNLLAINSICLTRNGEAAYLIRLSELEINCVCGVARR